MESKIEHGERINRDSLQTVEAPPEKNSRLEKVMSFWGSYCFVNVSSWTKDEVKDFADSREAIPEPIRRMRSIIDSKNDDTDKRSDNS